MDVVSLENDTGSPWPKFEPMSFGTDTGVKPDRGVFRRDRVGRDGNTARRPPARWYLC